MEIENSQQNDNNLNQIQKASENNEEIAKFKKEIVELKNEHNKYEEKIKDITINFKNEIEILKEEIINLKKELNELKSNQRKKYNTDENDFSINNANEDNDNNIEKDEDLEQSYSIECLSNELNKEILQGEERTNIEVVVRNNSNTKYPKNSFLICDNKNSLLLCEKEQLKELEPNQQQVVSIVFKNLKFISKGIYRCIVKLCINNKIYNSFFVLTVEVLDNHNKNNQKNNFQDNFAYAEGIIPGDNFGNFNLEQNRIRNELFGINYTNLVLRFKEQFSLYNSDFSDEMIEQALKRNDNDFNKAFGALYE